MELATILQRAQRGFRDDLRLHAVAVVSLIVAFLCLGTALLSVENLSRIAQRWSRSQHLTVYLNDEASPRDIAQLKAALDAVREVTKVEHISATRARELFAEQTNLTHGLEALPADAFPASLEIDLSVGADEAQAAKLAERIGAFAGVEEVETYRSFIGQFHTLLDAGLAGALLLAILVGVCVLAVISNTIRLAVANRRREIEVLKLCGATDGFVRTPFLVEGVLQAVAASTIAMVLLLFAYLATHNHIEATLTAMTGVSTVFLSPVSVFGVIFASAMVGALGSALSLRRYLQV